MSKRPFWPLLPPIVIGIAILGFLALNKWMKGFGFECGILKLTGIYCPGCGGTRCAKSIASGNWLTAMGHNAMIMTGFLLLISFLSYLIIRITILGKPAPKIPHISTGWIWLVILGILIFTVLRNIPSSPWSMLAP